MSIILGLRDYVILDSLELRPFTCFVVVVVVVLECNNIWLELSAAYFQPTSSYFLSQQISQQYIQPFIFSQANRPLVSSTHFSFRTNTGNVVAGIMRAANDCTNALSQSISSTNNQEPIGNTLQVSRPGLQYNRPSIHHHSRAGSSSPPW
jgi:hypothetical protein